MMGKLFSSPSAPLWRWMRSWDCTNSSCHRLGHRYSPPPGRTAGDRMMSRRRRSRERLLALSISNWRRIGRWSSMYLGGQSSPSRLDLFVSVATHQWDLPLCISRQARRWIMTVDGSLLTIWESFLHCCLAFPAGALPLLVHCQMHGEIWALARYFELLARALQAVVSSEYW